jgi:hypothetical protein
MIISGRIHEVSEVKMVQVKTGQRFSFHIVVEYDYNTDWPQMAKCEFFSKQLPNAVKDGSAKVGSEVVIEGKVKSVYKQQYDRWFTEFKAWKLQVTLGPPSTPPQGMEGIPHPDSVEGGQGAQVDEIPF